MVIAKDYMDGTKELKLAWKFTIIPLSPYNPQEVYVDADTGEIISQISLLNDVNTTGTAQTKYSGTQTIICDFTSNVYRLQEVRNGVTIRTLNENGITNSSIDSSYTNTSASWISGNWTKFSQEQAALDAHWAEEKVVDFWKTVFNRNSIDSLGMDVVGYVHNNAVGGDNAFWDGVSHTMNYGDGATIFKPVTALDVVAHEFGHGICQYTCNLTNSVADECAALNEGFSDIWGACVEHWAAPDKQTWLIGEDITIVSPYYLRSLSNPKSSLSSNGYAGSNGLVDTYHGTNWYYGGDKQTYNHENMSVLSHWFYLLCQGGSGSNDLAHTYSVSGIGIDKAQQIAYRAESHYLYSSADFLAARNATFAAAVDLYPGSNAAEQVIRAWYAVGVGSDSPSITGPATVCSCSSEEFTIDNLPPNTKFIWTCDYANIKLTPGTGVNNYKATVAVTSSSVTGVILLKASINDSIVIQKSFIANFPTPTSATINLPQNKLYSWDLPANTDITGYTWSLTASPPNATGAYVNGQNTHADVSFSTAGAYTLFAYGKNKCGASSNPSPIFIYNFVVGSNSMTTVYPNPVSDILNIEINAPATATVLPATQSIQSSAGSANIASTAAAYDIRLYDVHGKLMRHTTTEGRNKVQLNVSRLHNGNYYLHIYDGASENPEVQQIIVKH